MILFIVYGWVAKKKEKPSPDWRRKSKQESNEVVVFVFVLFVVAAFGVIERDDQCRRRWPNRLMDTSFFFLGGGANPIMSFLRRSFYFCLGFLCGVSSFSFSFLFLLMFLVGGGGGKSFSILIWSCCFFFRQRLNPLRRFLTFKLSVFSFDFSELETRKMSRLFSAHGSAFFLRRNCQKKKQTKPNDFGGRGWAWRG